MTVFKPANEAIATALDRIEEHQKEIALLRDFVNAAQKICTHEFEDADDLFNYHKREEYVRCKLCGVVH